MAGEGQALSFPCLLCECGKETEERTQRVEQIDMIVQEAMVIASREDLHTHTHPTTKFYKSPSFE